MAGRRKKKYTSGEGTQYVTRKDALKKLQLSLHDFRRLCIIKGIYPREPRNRKRAQKGQGGVKTLYHKKDIQFLMHEPIIWKMRDIKVFTRKVGRARTIKDVQNMKRYLSNHPNLKLDHIVKERYPTFIDALQDLDDCLTLCFLFSTFPSLPHVPRDHSVLCRRLTIEFLHAVIEAKALRKVFVSIKGYYFQAELKGQTITWIIPHQFSYVPQSKAEVDFKVMSTFVEFYVILLGFVNFRLYHTLNIIYPPKFAAPVEEDGQEKALADEDTFVSERVAALSIPVVRSSSDPVEEDIELDEFPTEGDAQKMEELKAEAEGVKKLKTLFKGLKVFLNREVPREPLVFVLRCFGADVSWDETLFVGATFGEDDETITHQVVDRPKLSKQYISRYYVQPQWVFDSVNMRQLLPVEKYFNGVTLPPHLSPFINEDRHQEYMPPEERALRDPSYIERNFEKENESEKAESEASADDTEGNASSNEVDEEEEEDEQGGSEIEEDATDRKARKERKRRMSAKPGKVFKEDPADEMKLARQEYKLREKMIKKKHLRLYKSMMAGKQKRAKEIWLLRKKRRLNEEQVKAGTSG